MYNPDDKDIDRLSREAAEHYHAPGTPSWETLRQTLDKELPQEKEKKRRGFLFFFLLFAGLSLAGNLRDELLELGQIRLFPAIREDAGSKFHHYAGNIFQQFATHAQFGNKMRGECRGTSGGGNDE